MKAEMTYEQTPPKQRSTDQFRLTDDTRRRLNALSDKYGRGIKTRIAEAAIRRMVEEIEREGIKALYHE